MKISAGICAAIFLLAVSAPVVADDLSRYPIRPDGIGPLKIGMSVTELETASRLRVTNIKRSVDPDLDITQANIESVGLEFYGKKLSFIFFDKPEYKTEDGIKIGDTIDSVISKYPSAKIETGKDDYHFILIKDKSAEKGIELSLDNLNNNTIIGIVAGLVPAPYE